MTLWDIYILYINYNFTYSYLFARCCGSNLEATARRCGHRQPPTRHDTTRQDKTRQDTTGDAGWAMAEPTAPMDKLMKTIPFVLGRLISFAYRCRLNDGRGPRGSSRGACRWVLTHPASPVGKASVGDIVPPEAIRRRGVAFEKVHTLRFGSQRRLHLRHLLTLGRFFPAFDLKKKKKKKKALSLSLSTRSSIKRTQSTLRASGHLGDAVGKGSLYRYSKKYVGYNTHIPQRHRLHLKVCLERMTPSEE